MNGLEVALVFLRHPAHSPKTGGKWLSGVGLELAGKLANKLVGVQAS